MSRATALGQPKRLARLFRFFGPFVGAGIRVRHIADDWSHAVVDMPLRWYNRNYVGTHYGGSLFSMTDPFYMIMLINRLGRGYRVWDQKSTIEFLRPGRGCVTASFEVTDDVVGRIREATAGGSKHLEPFVVEVKDEDGEVVARVEKTVYVRQKQRANDAGG